MKRLKISKQKGFTIVELMIATVVFSFVLIVASSGAIAIGRSYYKGVTSTKTQETARSIMEELTRSVQFSGRSMQTGSDGMGNNAICIGEDRYVYRIDQRSQGAIRGLIRTDRPDGACVVDWTGGIGLLSDNMRLLQLAVDNNNPHQINVTIAYSIGNDLLTHYADDGFSRVDANGDAAVNDADFPASLCKGGIAGSNFCSVSRLETAAVERIE